MNEFVKNEWKKWKLFLNFLVSKILPVNSNNKKTLRVIKESEIEVVKFEILTTEKINDSKLIQKGEIKESGNHKELLEQKGKYYKLWKEQLPDINNIGEIKSKEAVAVEV